jgi:hypothetical protein
VLHSGSLAVCMIGQGLAAARSLKPKHAIKQSLPPRRRGSTDCSPIRQSTSTIFWCAGCRSSLAHGTASWWP